MGFGAGNSALDLGKVPTSIVSAPLSSSSLPKPSRGASTSPKAELFAHFRERSAQMEPIHHPYSGGQLCLLPVPPFRAGFRGRCAPGSGALAVRSPPGRRRCSLQTPTVGSRPATTLPPPGSRLPHVLPLCPDSGNCGLGFAWGHEWAMAVAAAEMRVFLEVRRRLQSALLILG